MSIYQDPKTVDMRDYLEKDEKYNWVYLSPII